MANTPYPLPRQTRESTIQVGNGTAGPYGPSQYRIFDIEDVAVYRQADGEESFTDVTAICTVTKTSGAGYDTFSVTFDQPLPATTRWYHAARRVANRSIAVTRAGTLMSDELEKELSKQATVLAELRRDIGRALKVDPDQDEIWVKSLPDGHISVWRNGQMVDGGSVDAIHQSADNAAASAMAAAISAGVADDRAIAAHASSEAASDAAYDAANSAGAAAGDRAVAVAAANSAGDSATAAAGDRAAVAIDRSAVADDRAAAAGSAGAAEDSAYSAANSAGAAADDRAAVAIDRAAVADDKDAAAGSAGAASASAGAAASSASKANEWANAPENQPVEPGKFSAYHWTKKAEEAAGGGMQPSTYDPGGVQDDAFAMGNMAEGADAKIMTAAERTKLSGIEAEATKNNSDSYLLNRNNHEGTMPLSGLAVSGSARFVIGRTSTNGNAGQVAMSADPIANTVALRGAGGVLKVGPPTADDEAAPKKYVDDNVVSVYTGSNAGETNLPVGHIVMTYGTNAARNATATIRLDATYSEAYTGSGSGAALAGTWRARGKSSGTVVELWQRTA